MSDSVTLANVLASQVSVQWYEAVAVVREVADRLISAASEHAIPELQQIRLSPEGHLDIAGVIPTDEPVRRMGQLLQALVANADAPVQLRLVITQATSPTPSYQSVRDYSDALGFFERPERSTVLHTLASRVTAAALSASSDGELTLDSLAPLPSGKIAEEKKKSSPRSPQSRSRGWAFALVAAVILLMVAGGVWFARTRGIGPQNREEVTALADKASEAMGTAIVAGASKVTETLGLGRIVPAKDATDPAPAPAPAPPPLAAARVIPPRRPDATPAADQMPEIVAFDLEPGPSESRAPATQPEPAETTGSTIAAPNREHDETIYSFNSGAVVPPIGVRPKLARQLPPDFDPTRLGRVELIIGSDGMVESARLLGPPRTVNDGLFLSVAKAWLFQPALKNGLPVRYRKTIWVARP
jgi:hypothetical protein